jgi:hypothetical protein
MNLLYCTMLKMLRPHKIKKLKAYRLRLLSTLRSRISNHSAGFKDLARDRNAMINKVYAAGFAY